MNHAQARNRRVRVLPWTLAGVGAFALFLYGRSLSGLLGETGEMQNKFSKLAQDRYLPFLVWQNVRVLLAYGVAALAAVVVAWPLVWWWLRGRPLTRLAVAWRAFVLAALLHGYFVLRLVESRPYFVSPSYYRSWFYRLLELPPDPLQPLVNGFLFRVAPWLVVAAVVATYGWWLWRAGRVGRLAGGAVVLGGAGLLLPGVLAAAGKPAAVSGGRTDAPNILILSSDSLRGDRLGFAGHRPGRSDGPAAAGVSPRIDRLAAESQVFAHCFTPLASTIESTASLMGSQYPHRHGIRQMYPDRPTLERANSSMRSLAEVLGGRGYDTAAIGDWCAAIYQVMPMGFGFVDVSNFDNFRVYMTQAVFVAHSVVPMYFDNPLGYGLFPETRSFVEFVTPEVVTERVERRLDERARDGRPFFWHVFYSCNHLPYRSPEPYCRMFSDPGYGGPNRSSVSFDIDEFIGGTDLEDKWRALPEDEVRQVRALYDGCTRMFDDCVGRVLDRLRRTGLDRRTIVLVTGDHGDDLYEPGATLGHGLGFNGGDQANHVPFVLRVPGRAPRRFAEPVRTLDMAPTLADLAGVEPAPEWEGRSLAPWIRGDGEPFALPFYGETGFPFIQFRVDGVERPPLPPMDEMTYIDEGFNYQFVLRDEFRDRLIAAKERCLRTRRWKLICTPSRDGGRHFRLFHLPDDPHCERDVGALHPEVLDPMRKALEAWIDDRRETGVGEIFPGGEP